MSFEVRTVRDAEEFTAAFLGIGQYFGAMPAEERMQLRLPVRSLGSALLGGVPFAALRRAGRVEELTEGAVGRADSLFRWDRHPWCPEIF